MRSPPKVRVFSTMNGPQILAAFLVVGLLVAFNSRQGSFCFHSPGPVVLDAFTSAFCVGSMAAGSLYLLFKLPHRQRMHLVVAAILSVAALGSALQNQDLQQVISRRFDTLSDVKDDTSFRDRIDGYKSIFNGLTNHVPLASAWGRRGR